MLIKTKQNKKSNKYDDKINPTFDTTTTNNPVTQMKELKDFVTVRFVEEGKEIAVPKGTTVLDAAIAAGIFINSVCGGVGRCGKCKIIAKGDFKADKTELITDVEEKKGMSLACLTKVFGDLEVDIPKESKLDIHQILEKCSLIEIEQPKPLIWKHFLKLDPPSIDNNISDFDRIKQYLLKVVNEPDLTDEKIIAPISILRKLPQLLHEHGWAVTVTVAMFEEYIELLHIEVGDTTDQNYGLCVDVGTTTIVTELIDLNTGKSLGCTSNYNKQKICGEDVLSRIMYSEEHGVAKLQELVIENVNFLISEVIKEANEESHNIKKEDISYLVFAGNTTMTHMLLGLEPTYIRRDPYIPTVNLVPPLKAQELQIKINPEGIIYALPSRSSWVGGDITADIMATNLHHLDELSMMIDVGTNGEVVLGNSDWLIGCSCSAGPAFEGGEVQFGMNASLGAIEKIQLTDDLNVRYKTIGNAPPRGICGSGLIDIMAELFMHKALDRNGKFRSMDTARLKIVDNEPVFVIAYAKETGFEHKQDIYITETDIKNILRTKASVFAACYVLLKSLGYSFNDLTNIFIAGGFGNYLDTKKAIMLGLLPDVPLEKFNFIGNGSLAGTYLTLLSEDRKIEAEKIFEKLTYIELSVSNQFYNEFLSALFLPHTNISLFPTVKEYFNNGE